MRGSITLQKMILVVVVKYIELQLTQFLNQETPNSLNVYEGCPLQALASFWLLLGVLISMIYNNLGRLGQGICEPAGTYTLPLLL